MYTIEPPKTSMNWAFPQILKMVHIIISFIFTIRMFVILQLWGEKFPWLFEIAQKTWNKYRNRKKPSDSISILWDVFPANTYLRSLPRPRL